MPFTSLGAPTISLGILLSWGIFTSRIPSCIFVDRWRSQLRGRAPKLPLPCEFCILSMSQSRRSVFLVWPPCVPGFLTPDISSWWEGYFCTPTQSLTPSDGCSMFNREPNLEQFGQVVRYLCTNLAARVRFPKSGIWR